MENKICITGIGTVSSVGVGIQEFTEGLRTGKVGYGDITEFDTSSVSTKIAGIVRQNVYELLPDSIRAKISDIETMDKSYLYALYATLEAIETSGLDFTEIAGGRTSVCMGASLTGDYQLQTHLESIHAGTAITPELILHSVKNIHTFLSRILGTSGPSFTVSTACASSSNSIGIGYDMLKAGKCDIVIAGGADGYTRLVHGGFCALQALDGESCKPFSSQRKGTVLGEGAGIFVLETLEHAKKRGAHIYAELSGYSIANDAYHITSPDPSGKGVAYLIHEALKNSNMDVTEVDYINTHGTATPTNDTIELTGLRQVFGEKLETIYINSIKSQTGHLLGAAGAIEAVATVIQMDQGFVSPISTLDKEYSIAQSANIVSGAAVETKVHAALSNSFAFGGNNSCLVFRSWDQ